MDFNSSDTNGSVCLSEISSLDTSFLQAELNVPGLIGIAIMYALVFAVGIYATCRSKYSSSQSESEDVMLANRSMNEIIGVFTLTATWVGGDYVCGTAEYIFSPQYGLVWCQAPIFISLSLVFNGFAYAKKMWNAGYVTMLDPFEERFGPLMTVLLYLINVFAEVAFTAIAFTVLGSTLNVIVGLSYLWAVVISAVISLVYTLVGGLSSVAYTDILQLIGIYFGLWLAVPFAMRHPAVSSIAETARGPDSWLGGPVEGTWILYYIDNALLLLIGAGPWQMYFQRVLSQKSANKAMKLSIVAGIASLLTVFAPVMIGAIAASTDWNATEYREVGNIPVPECDYALALPLVMRFLTPLPVAVMGLGAVSAAAMSSSDSVFLSVSTMFAHNIYKPLRNSITKACQRDTQASDREIVWVLRLCMVAVAVMTSALALTVKSVVALIGLCVDLPYCVLFPQLMCVLYFPWVNSYGSFVGYVLSLFLRFTGGEPFIGLQPYFKYPWYDEASGIQRFPYKTMLVILHFVVILSVSQATYQASLRWKSIRKIDNYLFGSFSSKKQPLRVKFDKSKNIENQSKKLPFNFTESELVTMVDDSSPWDGNSRKSKDEENYHIKNGVLDEEAVTPLKSTTDA